MFFVMKLMCGALIRNPIAGSCCQKLGGESCLTAWIGGGILLVSFYSGVVPTEAADSKYMLRPKTELRQPTDVQIRLNVTGELMVANSGQKAVKLPITASAQLAYSEISRVFGVDHQDQVQAVRWYDRAAVEMRVDGITHRVQLSDQRRMVVYHSGNAHAELFAVSGPLSRDELDLIDVPFSSAVIDRLLPNEEIKIGENWSHEAMALADLLRLDVVHETDAKSKLVRVEGDQAKIELNGRIDGSIHGVSTEMKLVAKYTFDLQSRRIVWLAIDIGEQRAIGHASPGMQVTARIRLKIIPFDPTEIRDTELTDLAGIELNPQEKNLLLRYRSLRGGYQIYHDRSWQVMLDRDDVTVMRMVQNGDLIAQCNVSKLSDSPVGKRRQLNEFQENVRSGLGKSFEQFVEVDQHESELGLRILRVVAVGKVEDLPIQWIYCHVSNDLGKQASYVFTIESKLVAKFGAADRAFSRRFDFVDNPPEMTDKARSTVISKRPVPDA